jgi:hypothetical protein
MQEIRTSGSMSGDGKRSVAAWPKLPRPSSTLPSRQALMLGLCSVLENPGHIRPAQREGSGANDPKPSYAVSQLAPSLPHDIL